MGLDRARETPGRPRRLRDRKDPLLIALGTAAAEQGRRVRYVTCAALVNELTEAADDKQLSR